jgi:hypothetical protein
MESKQIFLLLFVLNTIISIFPIGIAINNKLYLNKALKYFLYYCLYFLFLELLTYSIIQFYTSFFELILDPLGIENTNFLGIFYFLRNFLLLGLFYSLLLAPRKIGIWIRYVGIGLAIACTINYLFIEGYKGFGVFNPTVDAIFCFVAPLIYCKVLFAQDDVIPLSKNPYFWITMGQLLVALVGFFLFFTEDYLLKNDPELFNKLAIGRNILMIIEQIMYAVAFYYAKNTRFLTVAH